MPGMLDQQQAPMSLLDYIMQAQAQSASQGMLQSGAGQVDQGMIARLMQAFMAPGRALQSSWDNPMTTDQMVGPATDIAGMATGWTSPFVAARGAMPGAFGVGVPPKITPKSVEEMSKLRRSMGAKSSNPATNRFDDVMQQTDDALKAIEEALKLRGK